ncbi:thioesterase family protein, partial [Myxococcota bacterium]|nr:thioesterase family protein [Myxococcota bacterium]
MRDFVYKRKDALFTPTSWAGSPWAKGLQHGGPINALFALAAEEAAQAAELQVVRMTVDLIRPVPRIPLALAWHFTRQGRRLANVEAELRQPETGELVSRAQIALLRPQNDTPSSTPTAPPDLGQPAEIASIEFIPKAVRDQVPPGFHMSFSVRLGQDDAGPAAWITTPLDLLPDTPMSPLQRSAAVADLTFALCQRALRKAQGQAEDA